MPHAREMPGGLRLLAMAVAAGLLMLALLTAAAPAEAGKKGGKKGSAKKFKYGVTSFNFEGNGDLSAKRAQSSCVQGESARWGGGTTSQVDYLIDDPELHPLNVGKAKLKVKRSRASGEITINNAPMRNRFVGLHHVATACFVGFPTAEKSTRCNPAEFNSRLFVRADINPLGKGVVEIDWRFHQGTAGGQRSFVPRSECGGEAFVYPGGNCISSSTVKQLKKKRSTLPFGDCEASQNSAPNTDDYVALGFARGLVQLKRNDK